MRMETCMRSSPSRCLERARSRCHRCGLPPAGRRLPWPWCSGVPNPVDAAHFGHESVHVHSLLSMLGVLVRCCPCSRVPAFYCNVVLPCPHLL